MRNGAAVKEGPVKLNLTTSDLLQGSPRLYSIGLGGAALFERGDHLLVYSGWVGGKKNLNFQEEGGDISEVWDIRKW